MRFPILLQIPLFFLLIALTNEQGRADGCCCASLPARFAVASPPGMVWIPGGEFAMGSEREEAKRDEKPVHQVKVDGFWMDTTPVTNQQFREFVEATRYITTAEKAPV